MSSRNGEFELEGELEGEFEFESEGEFEFEGEGEFEFEGEGEFEFEGEGELEFEAEGEYEGEFEGEFEGEQFFRRLRRIGRGIGGFVRRAAPVLRSVARVAAPLVGTAVGGPLGGMIGKAAGSMLEGEGEFEYEMEGEFEGEYEAELEGEMEAMTSSQATAEFMAAVAASAQSEAEAEAMAGAATVASIRGEDLATLRRVLPSIVEGTAVLTRVLRRRRSTRPAVRVVPTVVRRTASTLVRRAAAGQPVTRRTAARVMAQQTRAVLSRPNVCGQALQRNVKATRAVARNTTRPSRTGAMPRPRTGQPRRRAAVPTLG
jgi:hypothetical protein